MIRKLHFCYLRFLLYISDILYSKTNKVIKSYYCPIINNCNLDSLRSKYTIKDIIDNNNGKKIKTSRRNEYKENLTKEEFEKLWKNKFGIE